MAENITTEQPDPSTVDSSGPDSKASPIDQIKDTLTSDSRFWDRLTGKPAKDKKAASETDATAAKADGAKSTDANTSKITSERQRTAKSESARPPSATIDAAKLAEIQGREIGKTIVESINPAKPSLPEPEPQLPEEYRPDADVYAHMEKLFPEKYGAKSGNGLIKTLLEAAKREDAYITKWQEEHSGEEYNGDSDEHDAFYRRTFPEIDETDFRRAERELIEQRADERAARRTNKVADELRSEQRQRELQPEIASAVMNVVKDALAAIGNKEFKEINAEGIRALKDKDPIAAKIAAAVHDTYQPVVTANIEIHRGARPFDAKNSAHMALFRIAEILEKRVLSLPTQDRLSEDGRYFTTRENFLKMSPQDQANHWYVDEDAIAYSLAVDATQEARKSYDESMAQAEWLAKKKSLAHSPASESTQTAANNERTQPSEEAVKTITETPSPAIPSKMSVGASTSPVESGAKSGRDIFFSRLLRK